jgi:type IV secretion system protein VirB4
VHTALDTPELLRFLPVLSGNEGNLRLMHNIMRDLNSENPEVWLPAFMEQAK